MDNVIDFITAALNDAAAIANANFGKVSGTVKPEDNNQVLTSTDIEVGKLIVSRAKSEYPAWNIIDEEAGVIDNSSAYTWVVDPIDGTSNFANGVHTYGIMIGLLKEAVPVAGGIVLPYFNEVYVAEKGKGAFCNSQTITVTQESNLSNALVAYGIDGHQENRSLTVEEMGVLTQIVLGIRNLRTSNSAYDAAQVARGKYGACLNRTSKIWDNVAQQIIIEEAGGMYTDFFGEAIDYSNPTKRVGDNFTICAGAPTLHAQLQTIIRSTTERKSSPM